MADAVVNKFPDADALRVNEVWYRFLEALVLGKKQCLDPQMILDKVANELSSRIQWPSLSLKQVEKSPIPLAFLALRHELKLL